MADRTPRLLPALYNLAIASGTVITGSSAETSLPLAFLRYATPTQRWRSKVGWTVYAGLNDKLDFNRGGVKVATLTPGVYATGAALAAAVVAALEAADATPVWAASYSVATKKLTLSADLAFVLLFGTGANIGAGAGKDLGFAVADTASGVSQVAGLVSYHSRQFLLFDLGSAQAVTVAVAHGHNLGVNGTVTLYGGAASPPWAAPGTTQVLAGDDLANKRILFFGSQSFRYWALVIDDPQNTAGYVELGVPYIGTYWEPTRGYNIGASRQAEPLTELIRADQGALQVLSRNAPKRHGPFIYHALSRSDRIAYQAIEDANGHVFFALDPQNYPGSETIYGVLAGTAPATEMGGQGNLYDLEFVVTENLG